MSPSAKCESSGFPFQGFNMSLKTCSFLESTRCAALAFGLASSLLMGVAAAVPPGCAGDYNNDGACTDAADYVVWRRHIGTTHSLMNEGASFGIVDVADYDVWRSSFGFIVGSGSADVLSGGVVTPEPSGLLLAACGGFIGVACRPRRRVVSLTSLSQTPIIMSFTPPSPAP